MCHLKTRYSEHHRAGLNREGGRCSNCVTSSVATQSKWSLPLNASSSLDDPYYECLKHWTVAQWYSCSIVLFVSGCGCGFDVM